jgi:hypothetical protein
MSAANRSPDLPFEIFIFRSSKKTFEYRNCSRRNANRRPSERFRIGTETSDIPTDFDAPTDFEFYQSESIPEKKEKWPKNCKNYILRLEDFLSFYQEKKPQSREEAAALDSIKLEPEIQAEA